jgi:hypothetical protein
MLTGSWLISACAAAAYRLYASIHFLETDDETYGVGNIALGTNAELVCAMLVFYVPTLPKAFKNAKNPFKSLAPYFSRPKQLTTTSATDSHQGWRYPALEPVYLRDSFQHSGYSAAGSGLGHPHGTSIPRTAILRTTQFSIDEERGHATRMFPPCYFHSARQYSQMNSSRAASIDAPNAVRRDSFAGH